MNVTVDNIDDLDLSKTYTYADYYSWRFQERVELIRGKVFKMVNYPGAFCMGTNHQIISGNIAFRLWDFLCKGDRAADVFTAPFDVRLIDKSRFDEDVSNVVQPDISIFLDKANLDERGGIGTPEIVVEILIPGTNLTELKEKFQLYEDFGVMEYWIVFAEEQSLLRYTLDNNGIYTASRILTNGGKLTTPILPGFEMMIDEVFDSVIDFTKMNGSLENGVEEIRFI